MTRLGYTDPFEEALKGLQDKARTNRINTTPLDVFFSKYRKLTIDNFLTLLYSLFKTEGLLLDDEDPLSPNSRDKFILTEINPNQPDRTPTVNVVTYEIYQRKPVEYSSSVLKAGSTTQYKPIYIDLVKDADGRLAVVYEKHYQNLIKFVVWSEKAEDARRISSLIENFFVKNYSILRMHIGHLLYEGRGQTLMSDDYGDRRLYGVPMLFDIRTEEPGFIKKDDIVSVDIYGRVVDSFLDKEYEIIKNRLNK